jgi:hypothetical protein
VYQGFYAKTGEIALYIYRKSDGTTEEVDLAMLRSSTACGSVVALPTYTQQLLTSKEANKLMPPVRTWTAYLC